MILNFIDEVLASARPKYIITHSDNTTEEVYIDLATIVTTEGTPLDKALFDKIDKYLCPAGIITMWSGSTSNIPTGWALCNGQNGTPDLRDRFIVGAGSGYTVGETGRGSNTHTNNRRNAEPQSRFICMEWLFILRTIRHPQSKHNFRRSVRNRERTI